MFAILRYVFALFSFDACLICNDGDLGISSASSDIIAKFVDTPLQILQGVDLHLVLALTTASNSNNSSHLANGAILETKTNN
jgi:hypothetical protein